MAHNPAEELYDLMTGIEMQSDRSAPTPTDPATLPSSQQACPLMKLPTEV